MLSALRGLPHPAKHQATPFAPCAPAQAASAVALARNTESAVNFDFALTWLISVTFLMPVMALTLFGWFILPRVVIRPDSLD